MNAQTSQKKITKTVPNLLLIGSTASNVGKTEFACAAIRHFSSLPIVAVKVTTVKQADGLCPRGGQGCGVCSSLQQDFIITDETSKTVPWGKDTARLKAAGASRVFWLRVKKNRLLQGFSAFMRLVQNGQPIICESNSLRQVVDPGVFIIIKDTKGNKFKQSAALVKQYADRIAVFNGTNPDLQPHHIAYIEGRWGLCGPATAIVLAGGQSKRMGRDKSLLSINGKPLIKIICDTLRPHFDEILLSVGHGRQETLQQYKQLGVKMIPDRIRGKGPLAGIASCLEQSSNDLNFVLPCDMPVIHIPLIKKMLVKAKNYDAVVPYVGTERRREPLFAVYKKKVVSNAWNALKRGYTRVISMYPGLKILELEVTQGEEKTFFNLNTIEDYARFCNVYKGAHPDDKCPP